MVLSGSTDRAFVSVYGATSTFTLSPVERALLPEARHVHITALWQGRALQKELAGLMDELRARNVTISLDTQYDPDDLWGDPLPDLLARSDIFFPSDAEAVRITGSANPEEALTALAEQVPLVVMKQGAFGATLAAGEKRVAHPAFTVRVVDTTGAGDAFAAGFLHGWLRGWPINDVLRYANATGALAVGRFGAVEGAPSEREVFQFMEGATVD
jgi:sugar/nucleoside kinase (ribokinase family)